MRKLTLKHSCRPIADVPNVSGESDSVIGLTVLRASTPQNARGEPCCNQDQDHNDHDRNDPWTAPPHLWDGGPKWVLSLRLHWHVFTVSEGARQANYR